jgi:hypothetical protein
MTVAQQIGKRDFGAKLTRKLAKAGVTFHNVSLGPGPDGSYANGYRIYTLNDNETARSFDYAGVLTFAEGL